jgi:hypothetical protein
MLLDPRDGGAARARLPLADMGRSGKAFLNARFAQKRRRDSAGPIIIAKARKLDAIPSVKSVPSVVPWTSPSKSAKTDVAQKVCYFLAWA